MTIHVGALYEFCKEVAREARYCQLRHELAIDVCDMLDNIDTLQRARGFREDEHDAPTQSEVKTYLMPFTTVPAPLMRARIEGLQL